ncbi:MAG: preprotein translocase subunit YajC [Eubacteriales bacterium]|jgi:preprotein translocase subunit YajC|nr:preprotein translocase subunit YajC [Eubacteriales bacterium]MDD4105448.1 preprotein translocase subunit YajC [Eubacteriales bacterium]MDD4710575.1 preprotein translocase subunit YajC [Eubacteriales bacterium]NLO15043.1 preprotein translocase subunit YajC [Clostridiales bacterium]
MFDWFFGVSAALAETAGTVGEATAAEPNSAAALITTLLPMALIMVVFYFMLIRPQKKKDKKVKDMLSNLKVGDRICTIGGIYGTISGLREDNVILKVGEQDIPIVLARWAIRNVEAVSVENEGDIIV